MGCELSCYELHPAGKLRPGEKAIGIKGKSRSDGPKTQTWGEDVVELFYFTVPFPENIPSHNTCGDCLPGPRGKAAYWEPQFWNCLQPGRLRHPAPRTSAPFACTETSGKQRQQLPVCAHQPHLLGGWWWAVRVGSLEAPLMRTLMLPSSGVACSHASLVSWARQEHRSYYPRAPCGTRTEM